MKYFRIRQPVKYVQMWYMSVCRCKSVFCVMHTYAGVAGGAMVRGSLLERTAALLPPETQAIVSNSHCRDDCYQNLALCFFRETLSISKNNNIIIHCNYILFFI